MEDEMFPEQHTSHEEGSDTSYFTPVGGLWELKCRSQEYTLV